MDDRKCYRCFNGPWKGERLWLNTRSTAWLQIGTDLGRYVADSANTILLWQTW